MTSPMAEREKRVVFALGSDDNGEPVIVLGVPAGAWDSIKNGMTNTVDFNSLGLRAKLIVFGAENHAAAMKVLTDFGAQSGTVMLDARHEDFAIKDPVNH